MEIRTVAGHLPERGSVGIDVADAEANAGPIGGEPQAEGTALDQGKFPEVLAFRRRDENLGALDKRNLFAVGREGSVVGEEIPETGGGHAPQRDRPQFVAAKSGAGRGG